MFLRELTISADHVAGIGPESVKFLAKAGVINVADLLCYYPRRWEDRSRQVPLRDYRSATVCTVVKVIAHDWFYVGPKRTLKIYIEDESAQAVVLCFNRDFMKDTMLVGNYYRLWGAFEYKQKYGEVQASVVDTELCEEGASIGPELRSPKGFGHIVPVYPLRGKLTQGNLRKFIRQAWIQYAKPLEDELPQAIIQRDGLFPKSLAIRAYHFPKSMEEKDQARKSLIYEELFYLEVMVGKRAMERRATRETSAPVSSDTARVTALQAAPSPGISGVGSSGEFFPLQAHLLERLPFDLTPGQTAAISEINRDMDGPYPMARLLQGDVGSGKTLVAFLAALRAVEGGSGKAGRARQAAAPGQATALPGQAVIMAPTELLARQHAENAARLLEPLGIRPAFLTGNIKAAGRSRLLKALAAGDIDLAVGTHALFSRDVAYRNLRLVVIDEQHRFGVTQRQAIMAKGYAGENPALPDLLMMSATPIPRTLALTVFGDMDVSVIPDLPPGRKPIKTHLAREASEGRVYNFIRNELAAGRQAYFVYPLIEADLNKNLKDAESMAERLAKKVFPEYPVALVHSKLDDEEKRQTMEKFRLGEIRVLVATSVVEVGVDVPNASCMVVEHAERFGLSALHQLRGRVGRGEAQSYCFLVYSDASDESPGMLPEAGAALTDDGKTRLKVMLENTDGFVIAEEDLKLRGPGQIAGIEQSGYLSLGIAEPIRDAEELARARIDAFAILEEDPGLLLPEHRRIAQVLERAPPFSNITL
ncbi:ATP-dependent DNA helicase RecG [Treponema primitia ZAS-2]|uniref:ATP-dependent DNA helicase RecG n=1 Tax=Treponema primitia (strain ATCC BAA-887 / DSM 12427 / ZAS-2) TaxID=545694 RepID=F5YPM3_TREPZ|nr:ATP-dependent DNA helicase RecG [Treponema primitia]AEF86752.1 ATP-dependent DNA helicase RecG [Treponema primitia ZAS-2]